MQVVEGLKTRIFSGFSGITSFFEKNIKIYKKVLTNGRPYNIITLALSERKEILENTRNDNFIEMML